MNKIICCAKLLGSNGIMGWCCGKTAKYVREGKWYCGIHDPVRVEARKEKRRLAEYEQLNKELLEREKREAEEVYRHRCEEIGRAVLEGHDLAGLLTHEEWRKRGY